LLLAAATTAAIEEGSRAEYIVSHSSDRYTEHSECLRSL